MKKRTYAVAICEHHDEKRTKCQKLAHQAIQVVGVRDLMEIAFETIMIWKVGDFKDINVQNLGYALIYPIAKFSLPFLPFRRNKKEENRKQYVLLQDGDRLKVADMMSTCGDFVTIKLCNAQLLLKAIIDDVATRGNSTAKRRLSSFLKYMIHVLLVASVKKDYKYLHEVVQNAIMEKKKTPKVEDNFEDL